mmetsp:Transcript_24101/g.47870  ORF Transcript_24101/g.47870 Transcript_24101/m.47870 type:complete len:203 (-) Transcript_24101:408-1016(-)
MPQKGDFAIGVRGVPGGARGTVAGRGVCGGPDAASLSNILASGTDRTRRRATVRDRGLTVGGGTRAAGSGFDGAASSSSDSIRDKKRSTISPMERPEESRDAHEEEEGEEGRASRIRPWPPATPERWTWRTDSKATPGSTSVELSVATWEEPAAEAEEVEVCLIMFSRSRSWQELFIFFDQRLARSCLKQHKYGTRHLYDHF